MSLPNLTIVEKILPLELGGVDVILGMQWLERLGGMHVNWKSQVMKFKVGGEGVTLRGDMSLSKAMRVRTIRHEGHGFYLELHTLSVEEDSA